jgi:hypothetical protein
MPTPLQHARPPIDDGSADIDRGAFNAAFYELGLRWHWDADTYEALSVHGCERSRVRHYLEEQQAHLLRAYDAEFLSDAILAAKQRCRAPLSSGAQRGVAHFNWADARWGEVGI